MKKRGLLMITLAMALSLGTASVTAMAEGWAQEGNDWYYYNTSGSKMTNTWKKGADGYWRYLDGYGRMVVDSWVDDEDYYVDSNGIMVTGKWMKMKDANASQDVYYWYYFMDNGKAARETWKKIDNKWYYFGDDKIMQTGWILDDMYYCGTDGVMRTGWQKLFPPDSVDENKVTPASEIGEDDGRNWYYFSSTGKKSVPSDMSGQNYKEQTSNGVYYCFDSTGAMQVGWTNVGENDDSSASISDYKYFDANGQARTGWYSVEPPEALAGQYSHDVEWFYFSTNGTPRVGKSDGRLSTSDIYKINKINYLFNTKGNPVYGLRKVYIGDTDEYTAMYFGDRATSSVLSGKRKVEEGDGSSTQYYFTSNGRGYTGVHDNYLYYMGKVQAADNGTKYEVISIPAEGGKFKNYVVNTSGKIAKSTSVKNGDGVKYTTNSSGILTKIDDEDVKNDNAEYKEALEPVWSEDE